PRNGVRIQGFDVPAITTRRASTSVELRDGQSFAIAGLFQRSTVHAVNQVPWASDVPVLGALFKSSDWQKNQTELVIIVTPRLTPVAQEALPTAKLEIGGAERLDLPETLHGALELIVVDVDAVDPVVLGGVIGALSARPNAPAILLAGGQMPTSLVKALMKLPRSDVLEAPFTSVDLARAASAMLAEAPASAGGGPHHSRSWTAVGSVGGCGA